MDLLRRSVENVGRLKTTAISRITSSNEHLLLFETIQPGMLSLRISSVLAVQYVPWVSAIMTHFESNATNVLKYDRPDLSKSEPAFHPHLDLFISLSSALLDAIYLRHARTCIQEKKQRLDPPISKPSDLECSLCGEGKWLDPRAASGSRRLTACHSIEI